jgi:hypothetical protein
MRAPSDKQLCAIGMIAGSALFVCGAVPAALGIYFTEFPAPELAAQTIERLRAQPGGEALANCAIMSNALSGNAAAALSSFATLVRWQTTTALIFGIAVFASSALLLRRLSALPPPKRDA